MKYQNNLRLYDSRNRAYFQYMSAIYELGRLELYLVLPGYRQQVNWYDRKLGGGGVQDKISLIYRCLKTSSIELNSPTLLLTAFNVKCQMFKCSSTCKICNKYRH